MNLLICITDTAVQSEKPEIESNPIPSEPVCDIEKMIDFGAHSREFIDYLFQCHREQVARDNLTKLLNNGMKLDTLFDFEIKNIKGKAPEEVSAIVNYYINHMDTLSSREYDWRLDPQPLDLCSDLIWNTDLDEQLRLGLILRATIQAKKLGLVDGQCCAEHYFSYLHSYDKDAGLSLFEGYTPYVEEVERIREDYFSDDFYEEY